MYERHPTASYSHAQPFSDHTPANAMQTIWNPKNPRERSHSADMSIPAWMQSGYIGVPRTTATYRYT